MTGKYNFSDPHDLLDQLIDHRRYLDYEKKIELLTMEMNKNVGELKTQRELKAPIDLEITQLRSRQESGFIDHFEYRELTRGVRQKQSEIDEKQMVLDKMYKNYEAEQFMLSEDLKKKREDELFIKEKELRDLQKKRFGYEGDLFKERQKLVKPIQDKVYNVVQKMAIARSYDFILDKSEGITIIFADPKLDKSDDVLKELGINN